MSVKKYFNLAKKVFLINRSITGKGTYKILKIFSNEFKNLPFRYNNNKFIPDFLKGKSKTLLVIC